MACIVAPHTGAWIETQTRLLADCVCGSHPTRVRGLKLIRRLKLPQLLVAPHTGAWIETELKTLIDIATGRTPHGCVD